MATLTQPGSGVSTLPPPAALDPADDELGAVQRLQGVIDGLRRQIGDYSGPLTAMDECLRTLQEPGAALNDPFGQTVQALLSRHTHLVKHLGAAERELGRQTELLMQHRQAGFTDPLTGMGNRRACLQHLQVLAATAAPVGLVLVDLDGFQSILQTHGQAAANAMLIQVAQGIRGCARQDTLVARVADDEFALVFPHASLEALGRLSQRVRAAVQRSNVCHEGQALHLTGSLGAAMQLAQEESAQVLRRAEIALKASREAGRNCCHIHAGCSIRPVALQRDPAHPLAPDAVGFRLANRSQLESQLRHHLEDDDLANWPVTLALLEIEAHESPAPRSLDLDDPCFQDVLWSICECVRQDDLLAEYDLHRLAVLLPRTEADAAEGPVQRLTHAAHSSLREHNGQPPQLFVGAVQVDPADDIPQLLARAEALLRHQHAAPSA